MAELTFLKAERKKVKLRIGLIGPSGSGKTYSALRLAKGIGGKIALLDTEHRRSEYYAGEFDFQVLHMEPPFNPERFNKAIEAAEAAGYEIFIIDSASHEWAGRGGILETHNAMQGNSYTNWGKVTPRHNSFVEKINYSRMHIILTIRGKDLYVLEENDKGKQVPKKVGMGGEQRPGFEYELTCSFMLDVHTHTTTVEKDNTHIFEGRYELLTEEHGRQLRAWAESGIDAPPPAAPKREPSPEKASKPAAEQGQPPAGSNGNGKPKDPVRQAAIDAIGELVKDDDLFSPQEREDYHLRIKKTTTAGVMVLKLEIAQLAQQRKSFADEFKAEREKEAKKQPIAAPASTPAAAAAVTPAAPPEKKPDKPADAQLSPTEKQALGEELTTQLAKQGWDDAPPGVPIAGPTEKPKAAAPVQPEIW